MGRVINTPYTKSSSKNKSSYHFERGFYQREQTPITHPVEELVKNELFERALSLNKRFETILPHFEEWVEPTVLNNAVSRLAMLLLNEPYESIVLEKTPDESLLVKAYWHNRNVYIDLDFDTDEPEGYEVVISVYHEKMPVLNVVGSFDFTLGKFLSLPKSA